MTAHRPPSLCLACQAPGAAELRTVHGSSLIQIELATSKYCCTALEAELPNCHP